MYINLMFIFILGLNWITTTPTCCAFTSSVSKPIITNLYSFSSAERNRNELSGSHSSLSAVTNLSPNKANSLKREQVSKATSWGKNRFGHTIRNSYAARSSVKDSKIRGAIDTTIAEQNQNRLLTAGDHPPHQYPGILGDSGNYYESLAHIPSEPKCGTVLISPYTSLTRKNNEETKFIDEYLTIRVAERSDDLKLAELRSKVFSKLFGMASKAFISCCCDIIESRRRRGAISLLATLPRSMHNKSYQNSSRRQRSNERVVGGIECSIHEFYGTQLGYTRPATKLLYITEVAVSPDARRCGIGKRLLKAVDLFADIRGVESIYLHVDVKNKVALSLYKQAGYCVCRRTGIHKDFTKSLNLHNGATRGRNHYLLFKHVKTPTIMPWHSRRRKSENGIQNLLTES